MRQVVFGTRRERADGRPGGAEGCCGDGAMVTGRETDGSHGSQTLYAIYADQLGWLTGGQWGSSPMAVPDRLCLGIVMHRTHDTRALETRRWRQSMSMCQPMSKPTERKRE